MTVTLTAGVRSLLLLLWLMDHFWLTDKRLARIVRLLPNDMCGTERVGDRLMISSLVQD